MKLMGGRVPWLVASVGCDGLAHEPSADVLVWLVNELPPLSVLSAGWLERGACAVINLSSPVNLIADRNLSSCRGTAGRYLLSLLVWLVGRLIQAVVGTSAVVAALRTNRVGVCCVGGIEDAGALVADGVGEAWAAVITLL